MICQKVRAEKMMKMPIKPMVERFLKGVNQKVDFSKFNVF